MTRADTEVAVVGAGPSGAWAAYELARRGVSVTIFDPSHPREKACGGGVTARALELVGHAIGPISIKAIRVVRFTDSRANRHAVVPIDAGTLAVASRATFDASLLAAATRAGARYCPSRVAEIEASASGVRLRTKDGEHHADFLIGADGANSLVRRRLAVAFRRDQLSIATGFYADGVIGDEIVIELVSDPPGYIWSFPRPDHLAIGICAQADAGHLVDALGARVAAWIRTTGIARDARLRPYSWPIPSLSARDFRTLALGGPRWCLIGDAAGLVDPMTREGIHLAIASAKWAADAIVAGDLVRGYRARVIEEAVPELERAAQFKSGFFRPSFTGLLLRALQRSARIRAIMSDLIVGRQNYRGLTRRLMKTLELGLAWRAIAARHDRF